QALAIEHAHVDDAALRARLLGELAETVDVPGEDADGGLLREILSDGPTAVVQVAADVLQVALREDPALRDADDHDQHRRREAKAAGKAERARLETPAGAQPWQGSAPEHQRENRAIAMPFSPAGRHERARDRRVKTSTRGEKMTVSGR